MEYQKIISLLNNTNNQPTKFISKNWVEVNDDAHGHCIKYTRIRIFTNPYSPVFSRIYDSFLIREKTGQ